MSQWFVETVGQQIEGPFSTEMIQSRLQAGQLRPTDRIWGRVLEEWRPLDWWAASLSQLSQQEQAITNPEVWHYAHNGANFGPYNWNDLIQHLKMMSQSNLDQLTQVMIWTRGMKEWSSILDFHEIMEAMGVNKREYARAGLKGRVAIKSQGNTYLSSLKNVSEGGFGCDPIPGLISGEFVTVELQSDAFKGAVHGKAQVCYVTDRNVGFRFIQISVENRAQLVQHVRKSHGASRFFVKAA